MSTLANLYADKTDLGDIVAKLDEYGICIVQGFLDSISLEELISEFNQALDGKVGVNGCVDIHKHPKNSGSVARYNAADMQDIFLRLKGLFCGEFSRSVTESYFSTTKSVTSEQIFLTYELESEEDILPWHFDRQEALKFYINLDDVNMNNGALQYDVGSHREGHLIANHFILQGTPVGKIPNDVPEKFLRCPIAIEVSAGDLVIFDPAGFHKAGKVKVGRRRRVARGHSHPIPIRRYSADFLSLQWFSESFLNFQKILGKKVVRKSSTKLLAELKRTRK